MPSFGLLRLKYPNTDRYQFLQWHKTSALRAWFLHDAIPRYNFPLHGLGASPSLKTPDLENRVLVGTWLAYMLSRWQEQKNAKRLG